MLLEIKAQSGQSMYDLCLMSYGTLDKIAKLCDDNGVDSVDYVPVSGEKFSYESTQVFNQQRSLINQATSAYSDEAGIFTEQFTEQFV